MRKYIYQYEDWKEFSWNDSAISSIFGEVRHLQGLISGQMQLLGFSTREETTLNTLALDVVKSSEIEGEILDYSQVRSSIAERLGINTGGVAFVGKDVQGVVEMMLDATQNYSQPLTDERLFGWHACLFPSGRSGLHKIEAGKYRSGIMQVVSGAMGKEKVHYEAPPPETVKAEMDTFLAWLNADTSIDLVLKSAIAHFWFIIIHPFDDGNGRIARAIADLMLARSDGSVERYYSMSSQILVERKQYYEVLKKVQHSTNDITEWLLWYLNCLKNALLATIKTLQHISRKANFWNLHENMPINERQRIIINRLMDNFQGKLTSSKWAKITKCSPDTALRDIKDLIEKNIFQQESGGGRSTSYKLIFNE